MNDQKRKREPLLYIQQPGFQTPKVSMQETYSAKKAEERKQKLLEEQSLKQQVVEQSIKEKSEKKQDIIESSKKEKKKKRFFLEGLGEPGFFGATLKEDVVTEGTSGKLQEPAVQSSQEVRNIIEQYEEETREESSKEIETNQSARRQEYSIKRVKSFREMNTMERLHYLINFPRQLPPVPCIFQTEEAVVKGFLMSKTDQEIEVKLMDKSKLTIKLANLKEVRMLGLN